MKLISVIVFTTLLLLTNSVSAKDLGTYGKTYPIDEISFLDVIQEKLLAKERSGETARMQEEYTDKAKAYVQRPYGVELPTATEPRVHYYDPTKILEADISDANGVVLFQAGQTFNPLEYISVQQPMVFFDGDNFEQGAWVHNLLTNNVNGYTPILTNGPIIDLMKAWNIRLYFDQGSELVNRLNIESLPAIVRQDGWKLRIDELPPIKESKL